MVNTPAEVDFSPVAALRRPHCGNKSLAKIAGGQARANPALF
jgi:hypothetical protein